MKKLKITFAVYDEQGAEVVSPHINEFPLVSENQFSTLVYTVLAAVANASKDLKVREGIREPTVEDASRAKVPVARAVPKVPGPQARAQEARKSSSQSWEDEEDE